jgi:hypothetical protein
MWRLLVLIALLSVALSAFGDNPKIVKLGDGFVRVEAAAYSIEIPEGWEVGQESGFGQRKMTHEKGEMTAMTAAGGGKQSWDQLYQTSLYFIKWNNKGTPTPYKVSKTKSGYEAASFSMIDKDGFADERFVLLKGPTGNLLALSIKIPTQQDAKTLEPIFDRLVKTANLK